MALLSTYGPSNCVVDCGLVVAYTRRRVYGAWTYLTSAATSTTLGCVWAYMRTATKCYRYVGMTYSAAKTCADAMLAKYARASKSSEWDGSYHSTAPADRFETVDAGTVPMADVALEHVDGSMWNVVVNVREADERMSVNSLSPTAFFPTEQLRTYGPSGDGTTSEETEGTEGA